MRSAVVALLLVLASSPAFADDEPVRQPVVKQIALGTLTTFVGAVPGGLWLIDCSESMTSSCNQYPPLAVTAVGALAGASLPVYWIGHSEREHSSLPITVAGSVAGLGVGSLIAWGTMESTPFVAVTSLLVFPPVGATIAFGLSRSPKTTVVPVVTGNSVGLAGTF